MFKEFRLGLFLTMAIPALLLAACSGSEKPARSPEATPATQLLFDPARGDELAQAAILLARDLPGSGWTNSAPDDAATGNGTTDEVYEEIVRRQPACAGLAGLIEATKTRKSTETVVGIAEADYERVESRTYKAEQIGMEVEIHPTSAEARAGFAAAKSFLEGTEAGECLELFFQEVMKQGSPIATVSVSAVKPMVTPPQGGTAMAFKFSIQMVPGLTIESHMEIYLWVYANARIQVLLAALDTLSADTVKQTLDAADRKIIETSRNQNVTTETPKSSLEGPWLFYDGVGFEVLTFDANGRLTAKPSSPEFSAGTASIKGEELTVSVDGIRNPSGQVYSTTFTGKSIARDDFAKYLPTSVEVSAVDSMYLGNLVRSDLAGFRMPVLAMKLSKDLPDALTR